MFFALSTIVVGFVNFGYSSFPFDSQMSWGLFAVPFVKSYLIVDFFIIFSFLDIFLTIFFAGYLMFELIALMQ